MLDVTNGEPGAMPTAPVQAEQQAGGTAGMADSEQPGLTLEDALRQICGFVRTINCLFVSLGGKGSIYFINIVAERFGFAKKTFCTSM